MFKEKLAQQELSEDLTQVKKRGVLDYIILIVGVGLCVFTLYSAGFGMMTAMKHRMFHLGLLTVIGILLKIKKNQFTSFKDWLLGIIDILVCIAGVYCIFYLFIEYQGIMERTGRFNSLDIFTGGVLIVIVMWLTYRTVGIPMTIIGLVALLYAVFGGYIRGSIGHRGYSLRRIISVISWSSDGVFSSPLGASSTFVIMFLILAQIMEHTGAGQFFINIALSVTGKRRGGPAKTAIVASGLLGSISGSAVANVVSTGTFTIPLMKKAGFKAKFAGAVEAVASTGGQIMPPVMGAVAFVMAEVTSIPYIQIAKAALIPAILYYVALYFIIDLNSRKNNLKGLEPEDIPIAKKEFVKRGHLVIPFVVLIGLLLTGKTAMMAGFYAVIATFLVAAFRKVSRISLKTLVISFDEAARGCVSVCSACACAGIITGVLSLTGLGIKFSSLVVTYSHGILIVALLLTMVASLILGMGLPTTASYILLSTLIAPALIDMGVNKLAAHLFVLYFGCISAITPPVALASYAAAGISGSNAMETGYVGFRLGLSGFIVPFMFVYGPELMLSGTVMNIILAVITAITGIFLISVSLEGWFSNHKVGLPFRIIIFISAILLLKVGFLTDAIGIGVGCLSLLINYLYQNKGSEVKS